MTGSGPDPSLPAPDPARCAVGDRPAAVAAGGDDLRRGIIHTRVSRRVAWALVGAFVVAVFAVPLVQVGLELSRGQRPGVLRLADAAPDRRHLRAWEDDLERASGPRQAVRPHVQALLTAAGGFGNSSVVVGRGDWLFYRPGVDYVAGPGILSEARLGRRNRLTTHDDGGDRSNPPAHRDPRPAILAFDRRCRDAGARLVVVPVPDKATVEAARLSRRVAPGRTGAPPNNVDYDALIAQLRAAGVDVFDPLATVPASADPLFLAHDTHWTPQWMAVVAQRLAGHVAAVAPLRPARPGRYRTREAQAAAPGDLVEMLGLPPSQRRFLPQAVTIAEVVEHPSGDPWRPTPDAIAEVLVLGDSFANIYSAPEMGWGESAGLVEHLALSLQRPVDRITRNDAGAHATRELLAGHLARGRNRLAGKKVVVWQFAARELTAGDWRPVDLPLGTRPPAPGRAVVPARGTEVVVTGTVAAVAPAARPGAGPYWDQIVAVHLVDVEVFGGPAVTGTETLVYTWGLRENAPTPAARYRLDQRVTLRLRPWADVAPRLERVNRRELDDPALLALEPCWGEAAAR